jgi:hypothetical protein
MLLFGGMASRQLEDVMNHTQQEVREFFERQRDKLSKMAKECIDLEDRRRLKDMVNHDTKRIEGVERHEAELQILRRVR